MLVALIIVVMPIIVILIVVIPILVILIGVIPIIIINAILLIVVLLLTKGCRILLNVTGLPFPHGGVPQACSSLWGENSRTKPTTSPGNSPLSPSSACSASAIIPLWACLASQAFTFASAVALALRTHVPRPYQRNSSTPTRSCPDMALMPSRLTRHLA